MPSVSRAVLNAANKRWRDSHAESHSATRSKYYETHLSKSILINARARAKSRGLEFDLNESDIVIPDLCPVLGIRLVVGKDRPTDNSPTLDRIDLSRGYVRGNVAVISYRANRIKNDATLDELVKVADYVRSHAQ